MKGKHFIFDNRGFTLVEVLIALLVLGILFVPVSHAFLQSVKMNQHLQQRVTAVREAQAAMEVTLSVMHHLELVENLHDQAQDSAEVVEGRSSNRMKEALVEETALNLAEKMTYELSKFNSLGIFESDTRVEIAPLHEDSPFVIITATCPSNTNSYDKVPAGNFTLTTLGLPGEAPWLTSKEYQVVTP